MSTASDGDKADEGTIAGVDDAPSLLEEEAKDELGEGTGSTRKGCGHSSPGSNLCRGNIVNEEGRAGVESIPAKPEEDGSKDDEDCRMAGHINGLSSSVKASKAGSNKDGCSKTASATDHVHNTRTSEVNVAAVEEPLGAAGGSSESVGEPALARPGPVDNNRVDPAGDEPSVAEVRVEVEALRNGSSRDGSGSGSKGPLVEEVRPASILGIVGPHTSGRGSSEAVFIPGEAVESISNEGVGVGSLSVGDTETAEMRRGRCQNNESNEKGEEGR